MGLKESGEGKKEDRTYVIVGIVITLLIIIYCKFRDVHDRCDRIETWLRNEREYKQEYRSYGEYVDEWCEMKYWDGRDLYDDRDVSDLFP